MKILVATDAWHPQVNGVVRTLSHVAREARALGVGMEFLSPYQFWTLPMPGYPEIRLAMVTPGNVERHLERMQPDAIHVATEGRSVMRCGASVCGGNCRSPQAFTRVFQTIWPSGCQYRSTGAVR